MLIKRCVVCDKEFPAEQVNVITCSEECRKARQYKVKRTWDQKNKNQSEILINIAEIKKQFHAGQKVKVLQDFEGSKSAVHRNAKILKCYKHFALCKLRNYKETFSYEKISLI